MATFTTTAINVLRRIAGSSNANDLDVGIAALADDLDPMIAQIGAVMEWAGAADPSGGKWAICDGRPLSRTTYAALFSVVATTYGAGNGTTTFNIPDTIGRTVVSPDPSAARIPNSSRALGQTGGEERHQLTTPELAKHPHGVTDPGHFHTSQGSHSIDGGFGTPAYASPTINSVQTNPATTGITVNEAGGDQPHNNMQPYVVLNRIIRIA